jgi:spermidine synthase
MKPNTQPLPTANHSSLTWRNATCVFLAGAVILFVELAGAKLLAVVFGSSLYVWSALITVTLLSMAVGAWWGGRLADRRPFPGTLAWLWIGSALSLGAAVPLRQLVFPLTDQMDLRLGTILSSLALFFFPLAFLSAVSPVVIKLSDPLRDNLGRTVGKISALGTAGSCFGALATGFFLVPHFPLTRLFLYLSFALALMGAALWAGARKTAPAVFLIFWCAILVLFSPERPFSLYGNSVVTAVLDLRQSLYGQIQVVENDSSRLLFLDGIFQGGKEMPSGISTSEYAVSMEVLGCSAVPKARNALVIGLGSGIIPSNLAQRGIAVDIVEINSQMVELGKKWFNLGLPPERIHLEDGRRFLRKSPATFDLVFLDAFSGEEIPAHLLTREAFQDIHKRLSENGALVLNYVGFLDPAYSRVLFTVFSTLKTVFSSVETFSTGAKGDLSNFIIVARTNPGSWNPVSDVAWGKGNVVSLKTLLNSRVQPGTPYTFLFTDDFCPLDWLDRKTRFTWRKDSVSLMSFSSAGL